MRSSETWLNRLADGGMHSLKELVRYGAHPQTLRRMVDAGRLVNPAHGLYQAAEAASEFTAFEQFAVIAKVAPGSLIWLLSAAQFHEITQVMPDGIYTAVRTSQRGVITPGGEFGFTEVKVTRLANEASFNIGVDQVKIRGVDVAVTSPERTIVDMWRYSVMNTKLQQRYVKIDEETFFDAMASYASKFEEDGLSKISAMALEFGVFESMAPHLKSFEAGSKMVRP